jgi:hypothetical protein
MVSLSVSLSLSLLIRVVWQALVWIILARDKDLWYHCLCLSLSLTVNTSSMAGYRLDYSGSG